MSRRNLAFFRSLWGLCVHSDRFYLSINVGWVSVLFIQRKNIVNSLTTVFFSLCTVTLNEKKLQSTSVIYRSHWWNMSVSSPLLTIFSFMKKKRKCGVELNSLNEALRRYGTYFANKYGVFNVSSGKEDTFSSKAHKVKKKYIKLQERRSSKVNFEVKCSLEAFTPFI